MHRPTPDCRRSHRLGAPDGGRRADRRVLGAALPTSHGSGSPSSPDGYGAAHHGLGGARRGARLGRPADARATVSTTCASSRCRFRIGSAARSTRGSFDRSTDRWRSSASAARRDARHAPRADGRLREPRRAASRARRGLTARIAFVNHRMPPYDEEHDDPGYRVGVQARSTPPPRPRSAAPSPSLVRSVTAVSLRTPHTGALGYEDGVPKIPAAAVSIEDADLLARARAARAGRDRAVARRANAAGCPERQRRRRAARPRASGRGRAARRAHRFVGRRPGRVRRRRGMRRRDGGAPPPARAASCRGEPSASCCSPARSTACGRQRVPRTARRRAACRRVRDRLRDGGAGCDRRRQRGARAGDGAAAPRLRTVRHPSLPAARLRRRRATDRRRRARRHSTSSRTGTTTSTSTTPRPTRSTRSDPRTCAGTPPRSRCSRICSPSGDRTVKAE